jgi:hypothetical protein
MSLGDLDQDGSPDVVLGASVTPPGVAVLLGRGDGTLKARQDVAVGADPLSVVLSDFDADHVFDMATANSLDDQVQVLFGRGDGTFGSSRTYDVGRSPAFVAAADLNGDRRNDLLVADSRSPDLEVLLNQGDGTFGTPVRYQSGTDPVSIATADLNHDGAIDVVLANTAREGSVAVLLGNGDGTLQPPVFFGAGQFPASVVAVDLNGDRIPDLAVADSNPLGTPTNTVSVLIGDGAGNFARRVAYSVGPSPRNPVWVAAGDLNGDGFPDLAVANLYGGFLSVLLNQGDGTFGHHVDSRGGGGGVALGDFDGDGILDALVTTGVFGSSLQLLPGNGDGTFGRAILFQTGQSPLQVVVGDVNRDDLPDAVTVNAVGNTVSVLLNTGSVGSS